jgi:hypothetical protein
MTFATLLRLLPSGILTNMFYALLVSYNYLQPLVL